MDTKLTTYREIDSQMLSLGGAASPKAPKWPKRYPAMKRGEVNYAGAGLIPVCVRDGVPYLLAQRRLKGKTDPTRWYDFGGKKQEREFPSMCACRHFAKQTYGLFGLQAPHLDEAEGAQEDLEELLHGSADHVPASLPLLVKTCEEWAKSHVAGELVFFHSEQNYFSYIIQVPYIKAALLDAAATTIDGKRTFSWLTCDEFCSVPLAERLHVDALIQEVSTFLSEFFEKEMDLDGRSEYTVTVVHGETEKVDDEEKLEIPMA
eukprot:GEMP01063988.1.p1 GENE.GEMP01063988.1~~GEMP01063988.1.p1  ORF type:complete len:262 (+),score=83.37 GEMP01063988.1:221-1006(+)